jgi:hypothetical protein
LTGSLLQNIKLKIGLQYVFLRVNVFKDFSKSVIRVVVLKIPGLERIISKEPTDHKLIRPDGGALFVHCAMDAVLYCVVTGESVEVETRIQGEVKRFPLTPDTTMMMSYIDRRYSDRLPKSSSTPSNRCPFLRFFDDPVKFEDWRKTLPPHLQEYVTLVSVRDAFTMVEQFVKGVRDRP